MSKEPITKPAMRSAKGQFVKGVSGNPGGRIREVTQVMELAREYTTDAIDALKNVLKSADSPPAAKVSAATVILDRGWGKPKETVDMTVKQTLEDLVLASMRRGKDDEAQESVH